MFARSIYVIRYITLIRKRTNHRTPDLCVVGLENTDSVCETLFTATETSFLHVRCLLFGYKDNQLIWVKRMQARHLDFNVRWLRRSSFLKQGAGTCCNQSQPLPRLAFPRRNKPGLAQFRYPLVRNRPCLVATWATARVAYLYAWR